MRDISKKTTGRSTEKTPVKIIVAPANEASAKKNLKVVSKEGPVVRA
jgi:hypothetical protein